MTGEMTKTRRGPARLGLALVASLVVAAALVPASASAQGSDPCTASVRVTQDPRVAAIEVDCGDQEIGNVRIHTSDQGSIDENTGTNCSGPDHGSDFDCQPEGSGSLVSARFNDDVGDVCADPRLVTDFTVEFPEGNDQRIENVEVEGCGGDSRRRTSDRCVERTTTTGSTGDQNRGEFEDVNTVEEGTTDEECPPVGGVDSGAGGTASVSTGSGGPLLLVGAGALGLVLAARGLRGRFRAAR